MQALVSILGSRKGAHVPNFDMLMQAEVVL